MKKLLLIDGSSLLHRAFYALPLLTSKDGMYTNAVHGFMMMFNKVLSQQRPDLVLVAFDKSRVTFRNEIDPEYKNNRAATPPELRGQFELIKEVLEAAAVTFREQEGYEADDIIGTLSARGSAEGMAVEIFSGDRDVFQLVDDNVTVFMTKKGISEIEHYDETAIRERYGIQPKQLIDVKSLMGDSSDNIPGIPGVGEKTALKLICQYGDLDNLYEHASELKGKLAEKIIANKDLAYRCRRLATICRDMPLELSWDECVYDPDADKSALAAIYQRLGLNQLLRGLPVAAQTAPSPQLKTTISAFDDDQRPWEEEGKTTVDMDKPVSSDIVAAFAEKIREQGGCALYCLWENPAHGGNILSCGVAVPDGQAICVDKEGLQPLANVLEDPSIRKYTANSKELRELLRAHGIDIYGISDDVILAAYLLDPAAGDYQLPDIAASQGLFGDYTSVVAGASVLIRLSGSLRDKLQKNGMLKLYTDMELPLAGVLADMECTGVRVEGGKLAEMSQMLSAAEAGYQKDIFAIAGHEFNINSPKQLGIVLFEELGIPPVKKTKTGYSTNAEVLESLAPAWEIARLILDYRLAAKLRSTYTDGLQALIDDKSGKIHTSYKQTVTATGRLSSVEPNLQNIPVRHELGRRIRQVFLADGPEDLLIAADYNQIELRVLAHLSGDEKLTEAFVQGEDIHTRTASEVLGVPPEDITTGMRRQAKAVNFGIVYGISDYGLSRDLHISRAEAADYIARYFQRYPGVAQFQRQTIDSARRDGYVTTICGRRRYLPDLGNRNFNLRSLAERMAINTPVQGSAADIIKLAMISIADELRDRGMESKMILQVHDELIFNVPLGEKEELVKLVKEKMENALPLCVPLTVDVKAGKNWYEMEKID